MNDSKTVYNWGRKTIDIRILKQLNNLYFYWKLYFDYIEKKLFIDSKNIISSFLFWICNKTGKF